MDSEIKNIWKKYNYPGKGKLHALLKKEGIKKTLKDVEQFLNKQNTQQIFSRKVKQKPGHIVAFHPDDWFQMDLIDMSKFGTKNNG